MKFIIISITSIVYVCLSGCTIEGPNGDQRQQQMKFAMLFHEYSQQTKPSNIVLIGLPISASYCRARQPPIDRKHCLNFAIEGSSEEDAEEQASQARRIIFALCKTRDKCNQFGKGVVVIKGVWSTPPYSGNITPYGMSSGKVKTGHEFVFSLEGRTWN